MPHQARKYTTAQRDALVNAVLDDGMSQLEALRRAEHGELAGMKRFGPVARGTLQGWLRQAMKHRKREIQTNAEELRAKLLAELWEEIELTIPTLKGAEKIARIRQAAGAIDVLERKPNRAARSTKEDPEAEKPDDADDLRAPSLDRLRKSARATAQPDDNPLHSGKGTTQPSVAPITDTDTGNDSGQGIENGAGGGVIGHARAGAELDQVAPPLAITG